MYGWMDGYKGVKRMEYKKKGEKEKDATIVSKLEVVRSLLYHSLRKEEEG